MSHSVGAEGGGSSFDLGVICRFILDLGRPYVSKDAAKKLKLYKYQGGDTGFLYKYFYNPLALKIVENYTPEWLA
jgi:hypothetical protein